MYIFASKLQPILNKMHYAQGISLQNMSKKTKLKTSATQSRTFINNDLNVWDYVN